MQIYATLFILIALSPLLPFPLPSSHRYFRTMYCSSPPPPPCSMQDPKRLSQEDSSRSLGSTGEIVADNLKSEIKELDEDLPILQHELDALLVKGNQYTNSRFFHVLRILITKRLLTFVRSKEQIVLGVLVPLILSIIGGLIIHTFPTKLISPLPPIKYGYGSVFNTPVSGSFPYIHICQFHPVYM